jgi:hypothetical protein
MAEAAPADSQSESERLDVATDEAIAACGGDLRSTIAYLDHSALNLVMAGCSAE